jgi:pimeloyl-ACP methyl ester carboxylesterase
MPYLQIDGYRYYYYHRGKGSLSPAKNHLVFIHGSGGDHKLWSKQWDFFYSEIRVTIPDLPGHGLSEDKGRDRIKDYAEWLKGFLDVLSLENPILVGHSMGGAIAQELALNYPSYLKALVLVGTGAKLRVSPTILDLVGKDFEMMVHLSCEYAYAETVPEEMVREGFEILCQNSPDILYGDFLACDRFDSRERLKEISIPTVIICGTEDKLTPPLYSQYLHDNIRKSVLHLIEGAGHMVMLERPRDFNKVIEKFCRSLS